jgi:hypothetical protein
MRVSGLTLAVVQVVGVGRVEVGEGVVKAQGVAEEVGLVGVAWVGVV